MQVGRWPQPLSYGALRLAWCRVALLDFLRRWGVYALVGAAVLGAGAAGVLNVAGALAAWSVRPLFQATLQPAWLGPAVLLQAAVAVLCVAALRDLLWPLAWADSERALPLRRRDLLRSDATVAALALLPWWLLQAGGATTWWLKDPAWLHPHRALALAALLLSAALGWGLGVGLLQRRRAAAGPTLGRRPAAAAATRPGADAGTLRHRSWWWALLWQPLRHGPALRSGRALLLLTGALCGPVVGLAGWPEHCGWWLALLALLALAGVARMNALTREEFGPLLAACNVLPVGQGPLRRARAALPLAPLGPALLLAAPALALGAAQHGLALRTGVLAAYLLVLPASATWLVRHTPADPMLQASRWLVLLVLCIALGSEVLA